MFMVEAAPYFEDALNMLFSLGLEHNVSLKDAVMYAGKDFCGHQNDALLDARNTASLFGIFFYR